MMISIQVVTASAICVCLFQSHNHTLWWWIKIQSWIWVNFWQFWDSWIFEECWMWWQEPGQRQMGCQWVLVISWAFAWWDQVRRLRGIWWPLISVPVTMAWDRDISKGWRIVSHHNHQNWHPQDDNEFWIKSGDLWAVRDMRPILDVTPEWICGDINLHVIFMGWGWWDIVHVEVPITGWPVCCPNIAICIPYRRWGN